MMSRPADPSIGICSPLPGARPGATGYTPRSCTQYLVCESSHDGMSAHSDSACQPGGAHPAAPPHPRTGDIHTGMSAGFRHSHIMSAWSQMSTLLTSPSEEIYLPNL